MQQLCGKYPTLIKKQTGKLLIFIYYLKGNITGKRFPPPKVSMARAQLMKSQVLPSEWKGPRTEVKLHCFHRPSAGSLIRSGAAGRQTTPPWNTSVAGGGLADYFCQSIRRFLNSDLISHNCISIFVVHCSPGRFFCLCLLSCLMFWYTIVQNNFLEFIFLNL